MLNKISRVTVNHPWFFIVVFILITIFFALQLPKLEIDTNLKSQIPEHMSSRQNMKKIEELFGGTEIILLNIKTDNILNKSTLMRVKKLTEELELTPGVEKVNSLFTIPDIRGEDNSIIIEDIITEIPDNIEDMELIKDRIINNKNVYGSIVAEDFSSTAVILVLEEGVEDDQILNSIDEISDNIPGDEEILKSGAPVVRVQMDRYIKSDISKFLPIGILIMLVFLYLCFKQWRGIILPFTVVIMSIIVAVGFIPLLGWKVQMVTIILPVILLAVANNYGIHIIARYQEENSPGNKKTELEISENISRSLSKPILATGITTIIGLLCLQAHIIVPAKQLGILSGIGIGFALLASIMFIPSVLAVLPKAKPLRKKGINIEEMLSAVGKLVTSHPVLIVIISIIITIITGIGIFKLLVDTNPINYFHKEDQVLKADQLARESFGGSNVISLVTEGDILDPNIMEKMDLMVKKLEEHPQISSTISISTQISKMNEVLHNDDPLYNRIPDTREAVEQYLMLYSMSADIEKTIDFNYRHALINARIAANSSAEISELVKEIKEDSARIEDTPIKIIGGFAELLSQLVDSVVKGQIYSLLLSLIIVSIILILLFRSFSAGILSAAILSLSMIILFGLMGYLGIELNMVTALLSSIMIGAGIDYTIHFLWRYREERKKSDIMEAVHTTLRTTGRGIVFNALSVIIGFIVLLFSKFLPISFFGFLVVISISTCLLGALLILPAVCVLIRPAFLEKERVDQANKKIKTGGF